MQQILVAVDGSPLSIETLRWGKEFGFRLGAGVTAVTAWSPQAHLAFELPSDLAPADTNTAIIEALEKLIADAGLTDVGAAAIEGASSEALHQAAATPGVGALVMGTRGLGTIPGLMLGSVSRRMLFDCGCPLVLIPAVAAETVPTFNEVIVAVDGSPVSGAVTAWSAPVCRRLGAHATVLRSVDPGAELPPGHVEAYFDEVQADLDERWCEPFRAEGVSYGTRAVRGDPRRSILETATENEAALIVVAGRGAGQFQGMGGTTSYLVRHSPIALAVVPSQEGWEPVEL